MHIYKALAVVICERPLNSLTLKLKTEINIGHVLCTQGRVYGHRLGLGQIYFYFEVSIVLIKKRLYERSSFSYRNQLLLMGK